MKRSLLACFGGFVGEELDCYSAGWRDTDLDIEEDPWAVDCGAHDLKFIP